MNFIRIMSVLAVALWGRLLRRGVLVVVSGLFEVIIRNRLLPFPRCIKTHLADAVAEGYFEVQIVENRRAVQVDDRRVGPAFYFH